MRVGDIFMWCCGIIWLIIIVAILAGGPALIIIISIPCLMNDRQFDCSWHGGNTVVCMIGCLIYCFYIGVGIRIRCGDRIGKCIDKVSDYELGKKPTTKSLITEKSATELQLCNVKVTQEVIAVDKNLITFN